MKEYQYLTMTAKTTRDENVYCYGYIDDNKVHCLTATNDSHYLYFYEDLNIKDCGQVRPSTTVVKWMVNKFIINIGPFKKILNVVQGIYNTNGEHFGVPHFFFKKNFNIFKLFNNYQVSHLFLIINFKFKQ